MSQIHEQFHRVLSFYLAMKTLMITKNSVVKIQSFAVNHESRPLKSNPGVSRLNISNNISVSQARVDVRETEHDTTF